MIEEPSEHSQSGEMSLSGNPLKRSEQASVDQKKAERAREVDGALLALYREHSHELSAPCPSGVAVPFVDPGFVTKRASDIIATVISGVGEIVAEGGLSHADELWAKEQIAQFYGMIQQAESGGDEPSVNPLTQSDIQEVVLFVVRLLLRRHPGMTTTEITALVDREARERGLKEEQRSLTPQEREEKEAIVRTEAIRLYATQYEWGHYPELSKELQLTGTKTEDRLKIEAEEARLVGVLKIPTNRIDVHLEAIWVKIQDETATEDEIRFYKISRNKRRVQWFTNIFASVDEIAPIRGGKFLQLWNRADALAKRAAWMKEVLPKRDRIEIEKQLILLGRDASEAESKTSAGEEEVEEGERIINEVFFELYHEVHPDAVWRTDKGAIEIDREKLAEILGIKKE